MKVSNKNEKDFPSILSKSKLTMCSKNSMHTGSLDSKNSLSSWDMLFESQIEQSFEIEQSFDKIETNTYFETSDWDLEENEESCNVGKSWSGYEDMTLPPNDDEVFLVLKTKLRTKSRYFSIYRRL